VVSLSHKGYVYANNGIVSFLYDRPECKPKENGDHRCDVILIEFSESKNLWIIECKSEVNHEHAKVAAQQIEGCLNVISAANDWKKIKCVIGKSFKQDAVEFFKRNKIIHFNNNNESRKNKIEENIVNAVEKIKGC